MAGTLTSSPSRVATNDALNRLAHLAVGKDRDSACELVRQMLLNLLARHGGELQRRLAELLKLVSVEGNPAALPWTESGHRNVAQPLSPILG
jgi:hypothetical protein